MKRAAGLIAIAALAACDGGGDPVEQALREASAEHQARAVRESLTPPPDAPDVAAAKRLIETRRRVLAETRAVTMTDPDLHRLAEADAARDAESLAAMEAWVAAR